MLREKKSSPQKPSTKTYSHHTDLVMVHENADFLYTGQNAEFFL
jgi:hypothetical protein